MKNMNPLFTVCIPVFRTEEYVSYAIQDLLNQTYDNFECLIINDKTPDNAIKIIERLVKDNDKFRVIQNKKNLGVSESRNKCLEQARGQYILFLDSDDRYDKRLLEIIAYEVNMAIRDKKPLDVVTWEFGGIGASNEKIKELEAWRRNEIINNKKPKGIYKPSAFSNTIFQINVNSICVKCFSTKHLRSNKIKFDRGIKFGEDALFTYQAILLADNILAISDNAILYFYRREQNESAMHQIEFSEQVNDQINISLKLEEFLESHRILSTYNESFSKWVYDGVGAIMYRLNDTYKRRNDLIDQQIIQTLNSRSWRMTSIFRKINSTLKK